MFYIYVCYWTRNASCLRIWAVRVIYARCNGTVALKVIPQYCSAHPYCARLLASLACAQSARTLTTWRFLCETKLAREINGDFLLNEHGYLSFFLHDFDEIIIIFELNEFLKNSSSGKNVIKKNMYKIAIRGCKVVKLRLLTRGTF